MAVITVYLTHVVAHTVIVEPKSTLHARGGKAGKVKVDPTRRTVWILGKGRRVHISKKVASLIVAGNSRERYGGVH